MPIPFRVSLREPNTLAAVKEGYRLSDAAGVILSQGTTIEINPVCTAEASLTLGAIAGVLTVTDASGTAVPLAGGKITLQNNLGQTVAVTYTAEDEKIHVQGGDITFTPHGSHHGSECAEGEKFAYVWFELCENGYPGEIK